MGDRGQVKIAGVYLYTHWGAGDLVKDVKQALSLGWRWNDKEYLARIIFDVMSKGCYGEETGFGIGSIQHEDIWRLIEIEGDKIVVKDLYANKQIQFEGTFKSFLSWNEKEAQKK